MEKYGFRTDLILQTGICNSKIYFVIERPSLKQTKINGETIQT